MHASHLIVAINMQFLNPDGPPLGKHQFGQGQIMEKECRVPML